MKKSIGIFIGTLLLLLTALPVFASNKVNTIAIDAAIYDDGSMYVTQTWEGSFDEGTENYIAMNAPDYLKISDLTVTDINGTYETMPSWDTKWSFEEKANKCGINNTDTGYEICFGISGYGNNRYAIEYKLEKAVSGYSDMDGANFRFVNDKMNTTPTDVTVKIRLADGTAITDETADVWGFGFEGKTGFFEGAILAYSEKPITADDNVTVMFALNKGVISPARVLEDGFETVKQNAFSGSDYSNKDLTGFEIFIAIMICIVVPVAVVIYIGKQKKINMHKNLMEFAENFGYCRIVPNEGNVNASYALGRLFDVCEDGAILATGMLRLIDLGCLTALTSEIVGVMGKTKETVSLQLTGTGGGSLNEYDEYLYTVLEGAAGADGVLQTNELDSFAQQHDTLLRDYIVKCEAVGKTYLSQKNCLKRWDISARIQDLTPSGEKELGELLGFKKYLEDFSLIAERGVNEMSIWKELLSYAMLFGIADEVASQMKSLYPDIATEVTSYSQNIFAAYSYQNLLYGSMRGAEERREQEKRSGGSGGSSSFGGGGGSIGGGSGGGSR